MILTRIRPSIFLPTIMFLWGVVTIGMGFVPNYKSLIAGWRWLFIIEGTMTAGWSIIASFLLLDFPANSKRLTERERELAIQRIMSEGLSVRSEDIPELSHLQALKLSLQNWRTWAFVVGYMVSDCLA